MAHAAGARSQVTYIVEVTPGTTPSTPTMQLMRLVTLDINPTKGELRSNEILSDRQTVSYRHGMRSVEGTLSGELAHQVHDDMIEAALSGTWTGSIAESSDIGITNPDQVVRAAGSFLTDGFRVGDVVALGSLAVGAEDGNYLVAALTATAMTLVNLDGSAINLTTEAASATPTLALVGERCDIGTTLRQFTFERGFLDVAQYEVFRGVALNSMAVDIQPDSLPTISLGLIGMDFDAATGTSLDGTPTAAPTYQAMAPFGGNTGFYEGGSRTVILTGLSFELANGRTVEGVVGANSSPAVFEGDVQITGQVTALFSDSALYNKFVNETESKIWFQLVDPDDGTQFLSFVLPRVKYSAATKAPPKTGPVIITMPFYAFKDSVSGTSLSIQRSNT